VGLAALGVAWVGLAPRLATVVAKSPLSVTLRAAVETLSAFHYPHAFALSHC